MQMEDWQRRGLDIPDLSPKSQGQNNELTVQNERLRLEIARLKVSFGNAGSTVEEMSRSESFKLKEELFRLRTENRSLRDLTDPALNRKIALKRLGRTFEAWLGGTLRGIVVTWRRNCLDLDAAIKAALSSDHRERTELRAWALRMEKERDAASKAQVEAEWELKKVSRERDALLGDREARIKAEQELRKVSLCHLQALTAPHSHLRRGVFAGSPPDCGA